MPVTERANILRALCIAPKTSIHDAIEVIERNGQGIVLVVDGDQRLVGTVTDGDIRRAVLQQMPLDTLVNVLIERARHTAQHGPVSAQRGTSTAELLHIMNENTIRHIPLVDAQGRVVDIALLSEMVKEYELPLRAVVMAGGYGRRVRPLTEQLPKPMLPVGDRPLLELMIEQLEQSGIRRVSLTTHYKSDVINKHFGDGSKFGVEIDYVHEDNPLGTAGALSLLHVSTEPLLIVNGDIVTGIDFRAMLNFHREHEADMTVAVREQHLAIPYGVVKMNHKARVTSIEEKPSLRHFINAGIYLMNPDMRDYVPADKAFDMPDLITRLIKEGRSVVAFPIREHWFDIGSHEDYARAQSHLSKRPIESVST
jgi:dTDP-glucose pyrophosphorylase